jgi:hypothetical protein
MMSVIIKSTKREEENGKSVRVTKEYELESDSIYDIFREIKILCNDGCRMIHVQVGKDDSFVFDSACGNCKNIFGKISKELPPGTDHIKRLSSKEIKAQIKKNNAALIPQLPKNEHTAAELEEALRRWESNSFS